MRARPRSLAWRVARRVSPVLVTRSKAGRFVVSTRDQVIGRGLFVDRNFDLAQMDRIIALLVAELGPGVLRRTFVDVGANIGTSTIAALLRHGFVRAVAIEPDARNAALLRRNVRLNRLGGRVAVHEAAASAAPGSASLSRSAFNHGDHRVVPGPGDVALITLDGLLDPQDEHLLWIDAQGHEGHVFAGARRLLEARTPIVVEFSPDLLRAAGGFDGFVEAVARTYGRAFDFGEPHRLDPVRELDPAALRAHAEELEPGVFSDLVLLA